MLANKVKKEREICKNIMDDFYHIRDMYVSKAEAFSDGEELMMFLNFIRHKLDLEPMRRASQNKKSVAAQQY